MSKVQKLGIATLTALLVLFGFAPAIASAQSYDYNYDYGNGYSYDTTSDVPAGVGIVMMICWCLIIVFALVTAVITIMSLIHCIQNAPEDKKVMWILLILFIPFASYVYFFTKRKEWNKPKVDAAPKAE